MSDRIERAREELASVDERPVDEHPEVFADVNAAIVDELSTMEDEGEESAEQGHAEQSAMEDD